MFENRKVMQEESKASGIKMRILRNAHHDSINHSFIQVSSAVVIARPMFYSRRTVQLSAQHGESTDKKGCVPVAEQEVGDCNDGRHATI